MAPRPARLPNPKPTTSNPKDSRYERGTTGGQVRLFIRTIGIARARTRIGLANIACNMRRLLFVERTAAAPA